MFSPLISALVSNIRLTPALGCKLLLVFCGGRTVVLLNQTFRTSSNMKLEVLVFRVPGLFPVFCYFLRRQAMYV
jgi:hypothetical protein